MWCVKLKDRNSEKSNSPAIGWRFKMGFHSSKNCLIFLIFDAENPRKPGISRRSWALIVSIALVPLLNGIIIKRANLFHVLLCAHEQLSL